MGVNEAREQLRSAVTAVWSSPDMEGLRRTLGQDAYGSGFASCLKQKMLSGAGGSQSFRECAKTADLSGDYKSAWGKPSALIARR